MATSFLTGYPVVSFASGNSAAFNAAINDSGLGWFVVIPDGDAAPSSEQVVAGQNAASGSVSAGFAGSGAFSSSGNVLTLNATGLASDTRYDSYIVASGYTSGNGLQASPELLNFDTILPDWESGYPLVDPGSNSGVSISFLATMNDSGSIWGVVVPQASGQPSPSQISGGLDSGGNSVSAGFNVSGYVSTSGYRPILTFSGLTSETDYSAYFVGNDHFGNLMESGTVSGVNFTTADITPPSWNTRSVGTITTNSAKLTLNMDDAGSGYFVVVEQGSSAPNSTQIKAGQDGDGNSVSAGLAGSSALVASTDAVLDITNLQYSTYYTIYVIGTDDGGNDVGSVVSANFRAAVPSPGAVTSQREQRRRRDRRIRSAIGRSMLS